MKPLELIGAVLMSFALTMLVLPIIAAVAYMIVGLTGMVFGL